MKRKLFVGLFVFFIIFTVGGVYLIATISRTTNTLYEIITMHQVEIIREHLLMRVKHVQSDLRLKNTRYSRDVDTIISDVIVMDKSAQACFRCHHSPKVNERLSELKNMINEYKDALKRALTIGAGMGQLEKEEVAAFEKGEAIIATIDSIIATTSRNLELRTHQTINSINRTKFILFGFILLGSLTVISIAFFVIRRFSRQIGALLDATKVFKRGGMDYNIDCLRDEFKELGDSFNNMAVSLNDYWTRLEESERKYRLLFEKAKDAVFLLDAEKDYGKIIDANPAAANMHDYSREELLNLNIRDILVPEDAKKFDERLEKAINKKQFEAETLHVRKNSTVFPVEVSASLIDMDGHKYFLTFNRDISGRKQAEKKLIRTEQMKLCGEIATGIAHEIKNPLAGIKASIEVLSEELNINENDRFVMKSITGEIRRIESLLNELLSFASPSRSQIMLINVNSIVDSVLAVQIIPINRKIEIVRELDMSLPDIMADHMQIKQVILNLYINAVEAMPDGGIIVIKTSCNEQDGTAQIEVSDTGKGIEVEIMDKIFKPFFTTKRKGTGMGLSITKQIIEQHGGSIRVSGNTDGGAVFTVSLPFTTVL